MFRRLALVTTGLAVAFGGYFGSPAEAGCTVNIGVCAGNCTVNTSNCSGNCDVNTAECEKGSSCTVNTNTCKPPVVILHPCDGVLRDLCG
jgi:hypothetical protein